MYFGSSLISAGQQEPARSSLQLPGQIHGEYRQQCAGSAESHALAQSLSMQLWWPLAGLGDDGDFCNRALKQLPRGLCFSMDENYILLPHGVNFQEAIFPDTGEQEDVCQPFPVFQLLAGTARPELLQRLGDPRRQSSKGFICSLMLVF